MERKVWWIVLFLLLIGILLGYFLLAATVAQHPEAAAFTLGLFGFWLFANRLIFGFGQIANIASNFVRGEEVNKTALARKIAKSEEESKIRGFEELSAAALLSMWKQILEPFKYTYYLGFFLILVVALIFKLHLASSIIFGPIAEALTLGAAIPTVLVWGLELLADHYLAEAFIKAAGNAG